MSLTKMETTVNRTKSPFKGRRQMRNAGVRISKAVYYTHKPYRRKKMTNQIFELETNFVLRNVKNYKWRQLTAELVLIRFDKRLEFRILRFTSNDSFCHYHHQNMRLACNDTFHKVFSPFMIFNPILIYLLHHQIYFISFYG